MATDVAKTVTVRPIITSSDFYLRMSICEFRGLIIINRLTEGADTNEKALRVSPFKATGQSKAPYTSITPMYYEVTN